MILFAFCEDPFDSFEGPQLEWGRMAEPTDGKQLVAWQLLASFRLQQDLYLPCRWTSLKSLGTHLCPQSLCICTIEDGFPNKTSSSWQRDCKKTFLYVGCSSTPRHPMHTGVFCLPSYLPSMLMEPGESPEYDSQRLRLSRVKIGQGDERAMDQGELLLLDVCKLTVTPECQVQLLGQGQTIVAGEEAIQ